MVLQSFSQSRLDGARVIRTMPNVHDLRSAFFSERPKEDGIALEYLSRTGRSSRRHKFVAGRDDGHADGAAHRHFRKTLGGQQRERLRVDAGAGLEDFLSLA